MRCQGVHRPAIPGHTRFLPGNDDMPCVFTDEEFEDFYSVVEEDLTAYNQERADAGLATLGNPPAAGGGKGTGKEDEPFSDKDIEDMANSF